MRSVRAYELLVLESTSVVNYSLFQYIYAAHLDDV